MPLAKKATINNAYVKVLIWGEPGCGKSRFALSAPNPLVVDLEDSTGLYAEEFDFYKAKVEPNNALANNSATLVKNLINEINNNEYPDRKTLVIDPVTDLLDCIESFCIDEYQKQINKKITDLNAVQKSKWYSYRRETSRKILDKLKNVPMNLILVARSKILWDTVDGKTQPVGQTYDCLEIVESLMDIVINLEKTEEGTIAKVKKSRLANLPDILPVQNFNSIYKAIKAIEETKASSKLKEDDNNSTEEKSEERKEDAIDAIRYAIESTKLPDLVETLNKEVENSLPNNSIPNLSDSIPSITSSNFNYEEMMRLQNKHLEES